MPLFTKVQFLTSYWPRWRDFAFLHHPAIMNLKTIWASYALTPLTFPRSSCWGFLPVAICYSQFMQTFTIKPSNNKSAFAKLWIKGHIYNGRTNKPVVYYTRNQGHWLLSQNVSRKTSHTHENMPCYTLILWKHVKLCINKRGLL